jgi:hypothetical protein
MGYHKDILGPFFNGAQLDVVFNPQVVMSETSTRLGMAGLFNRLIKCGKSASSTLPARFVSAALPTSVPGNVFFRFCSLFNDALFSSTSISLKSTKGYCIPAITIALLLVS